MRVYTVLKNGDPVQKETVVSTILLLGVLQAVKCTVNTLIKQRHPCLSAFKHDPQFEIYVG